MGGRYGHGYTGATHITEVFVKRKFYSCCAELTHTGCYAHAPIDVNGKDMRLTD